MVMAPQKAIGIFRDAHQSQPHEGRPRQVESLLAILAQQRSHLLVLVFFRQSAPIILVEAYGHLAMHSLQQLFHALPDERRAQDIVTIHHTLPGTLKGRHIQGTPQGAGRLFHIHASLRRDQRVKQHPLLHRRERIDGLDVLSAHFILHLSSG